MPCSSASSSGSCGVAYPTFSGCKSLSFSRVSLCILLRICFIACLFPHCTVAFAGYQFLWVLQTWWETWVPTGLFSLALVWTLSLAGLMPRQLVPCWFQNDWRGPVALIPGILQLSGYNIACCCGLPLCALVRFRMFQTFASFFFFFLPWLTHDWLTALQYSCGICSQHCVPLVSRSISVVSLFPFYITMFFFMAHPFILLMLGIVLN